MGPIWVKSGPIWAGTWVPYGQPIWVSFGAHGPHLAQMGSMLRLHRTDHAGTIWAKWVSHGLHLGHLTSFPHISHITLLGPIRSPDQDTIWAPDGLCGNMGLILHGSDGQVSFTWAISGPHLGTWVPCGLHVGYGEYVAHM